MMATRHEATLNLATLLKGDPEDAVEISETGELAPTEQMLRKGGLRLAGPLNWQMTVRAIAGEDQLLLTGAVRGTAILECRRCLVDVPSELASDLLFAMRFRPGVKELTLVEAEDDEYLRFGHPQVDLAALLTQVFALGLPLTALCKPTCLGLTLDGVNLNEHPEAARTGSDRVQESPFARLKDIKL